MQLTYFKYDNRKASGGQGGREGFNRKAEAKTEREGKKRTAEEVSSPPANDNKWNQNKSGGRGEEERTLI